MTIAECKIEFRGDKELLLALTEYAKGRGLDVSFNELLLNSKKSGVAYAAAIAGSIAITAQAIAEFQKGHKCQIEVVTPSGSFKEQNYSAEDLIRILPSVRTNIFVHTNGSPQVPQP